MYEHKTAAEQERKKERKVSLERIMTNNSKRKNRHQKQRSSFFPKFVGFYLLAEKWRKALNRENVTGNGPESILSSIRNQNKCDDGDYEKANRKKVGGVVSRIKKTKKTEKVENGAKVRRRARMKSLDGH